MTVDVYLLLKQISQEESFQAFEKLYGIYFRKSFSFAMYFLKSAELAEEVVSDVFLNIWQNRALLVKVNDWDAYLYISIRRQSYLYLSQTAINKQTNYDSFVVEVFVEENNPEQILLKQELTQILQKAINQLPERCKLIYHMVREEELSYKQVANILNISERTVNTQMMIAVKKLRASLKAYFQIKEKRK